MKTWSFFIIIICSLLVTTDALARRTHLTPQQKSHLEHAQTIFLNVLTLTEKGPVDPSALQHIVIDRLREVGFAITTDRAQPFDVEFKVKCEEQKTWTGTTSAGGDAELADAPSRLWKGPACLFSYTLAGKDFGWKKEIRTSFENAVQAAQTANTSDSGHYAIDHLLTRVKEYDFPVLIATEWGQVSRLLNLLDSSDTSKLRKLKILSVLHELQSNEALPHLQEIMRNKDLAQEAIVAMAGVGTDSIPTLIDLFTTTKQPNIQAAAAKGLGDIAAASGDPRTIPPLLQYLKEALLHMKTAADINYPVLTQVVWALGKLRDDNSLEPMTQLNEKVWLIYDTSPAMVELREATNWTYKQLDLDGHIS
ncbi:MAG: HEAT repeat domain-containing protein [Nitrospirales bacterium]|nr:HEAT repeat domain-containing protein [Nitrospirales bacterium]